MNIRARPLISTTFFMSFSQVSFFWSLSTLQCEKYFLLYNITQNVPILSAMTSVIQRSFFCPSKTLICRLSIQELKIRTHYQLHPSCTLNINYLDIFKLCLFSSFLRTMIPHIFHHLIILSCLIWSGSYISHIWYNWF